MNALQYLRLLLYAALTTSALGGQPPERPAEFDFTAPVLLASDASGAERLAAREVRRCLYLRTGRLVEVKAADASHPPATASVVVGTKSRALVQAWLNTEPLRVGAASLGPEDFWLRTIQTDQRDVWLLVGGSETATLYAAYRFAEHLGARFHLHGDVWPDRPLEGPIPSLDERSSPLFTLRGIQPFHDFPEGPDWWNLEEYRAILGQLPKLRMNFFGLHTYPEGAPHAEPTVWIGPASEFTPDGRVTASYPSSYHNTIRQQAIPGNWGYAPVLTSAYACGAAQLFDRDAFGPDCMLGHLPQPSTPEACNAVFNATGELLRSAFTFARQLGIKTCVGTETPLTIPKQVQERLRAAGQDPQSPATRRALYESMFRRLTAAHPLDYYWFWTPEGWTWAGTKDEEVKRTLDDLEAAMAAHAAVQPPFQLATCGWVLGPQQNRALFDKVLPKSIAVSCINREVGKTPVDPAFSDVQGRGKWAIPWLEDDPALTSPQLWAGRMRRDAADAHRYGCDGLLGIHWRTINLAPNVAALAQAAWNQEPWRQALDEAKGVTTREPGAEGGAVAAFNAPIADTEDDPLYQTVRYNLTAYRLPRANGSHRVRLQFCEPHYAEAGKRCFSVKLQGTTVIENLDIFARVGQNRALDFTFENVAVTNGWLDLEFIPVTEFPSIAALSVEGPGGRVAMNCGGPAYRDYLADVVGSAAATQRFAPTEDFYVDWATSEFGTEVAPEAARLFAKLDGRLPRPSDWTDGPGGLKPDPRPWTQVQLEYAFALQFGQLRSKVQGPGNLARFDYWASTFRYMRAMAQVSCTWARYNAELDWVRNTTDARARREQARERLLPLRRDLVSQVTEVYRHLLATVWTTGELGTVMNWEAHILPGLLHQPGEELARWLDTPLPPEARLRTEYQGPTRIITPAVRTSFEPGAPLSLRVLVLAEQPPRSAAIRWRGFGTGEFATLPLTHVARGVYTGTFPAEATAGTDLEYFIEVQPRIGEPVRHPATAPALNQTLVPLPARW